ncbi:MAG: c-type cytochrome [Gemmatimonadaceae bacterium]|nr:c-type cytochrome [Gemmatimonadaceae bacterium]
MPLPRRTPRTLDSPEEARQLDRWYIAGLLCMLALIVAFPLYNAGEPARRADAQATMKAENVAIGRTMFAQHCASCHGDEARGGRGAPTLRAREFLGSVSDKQLHWLISGGIPGSIMSAYDIDLGGPFTAQEIARLAAYVRSLEPGAPSVQGWYKGTPAPPRREAKKASGDERRSDGGRPHDDGRNDARPAEGKGTEHGPDSAESAEVARVNVTEVFATRCAACHGTEGQGSPIAPAVRPVRAPLAQRPDQLYTIVARGVSGTAMAGFSASHGGTLDDTTIRALVAWMMLPKEPVAPLQR